MKNQIKIFKSALISILVLTVGTLLAIFGGNIGCHLMNQKSTLSLFIGMIIIVFIIIFWLFAVNFALYKIKKDILSDDKNVST